MTKWVLLLSLLGLLFCSHSTVVVAEELTATDYIEFLKPFEGSWKVTHEKEGKASESIFRVRLARSGASLITTTTGVGLGSYQFVEGYDPVGKKWTMIGCGADGAFMMHKITFPNVQKGKPFSSGQLESREITINRPDGTVITMTSKGSWPEVSENRMVCVQSDCKINGAPAADERFTLERLPAQERTRPAPTESQVADSVELTAKDYITFLKPFQGSWKTKAASEGKVLEGTASLWMSPVGTCFVSHDEGAGFPASQGIHGYDPVTKKWTVAGFDADGGFGLSRFEFIGVKKGQVVGNGVKANTVDAYFKKDGTTTTTTSTLACVECSENRIAYVLSDRKENGVAKPDLTFAMERQPDEAKRARQ